jgi:hypothetical protein
MEGIALIGLVLILCACTLAQTPAAPATDTPVDEPTSPAQETYTNPTLGYSIQYPAGLALDSNQDGSLVWLDRQISITTSNINPEDAQGDGPVIESAEDTTVGPYSGRRLRGYIGAIGGNTPQRYESVAIPHNNLYYVITVFELKNDVQLPPDRELGDIPSEALALFEQVLASLQLSE